MTKFESYCNRMWLDYCDEHDDWLTASTRLDLDEYKAKYREWLFAKFVRKSNEEIKSLP